MIYWVEIPHPFFLATLWGSLTDWTLGDLGVHRLLLLLLVSVYGVVKSVSDEWTGVAAAAVAGFPVLFGFGRFIHDTFIAALCTFMVWMALIGWAPTLAPMRGFGIAGWTMLRSGESFYGSVLGMLVILGPVLIEVGHALRAASRETGSSGWRSWRGFRSPPSTGGGGPRCTTWVMRTI